MQSKQGKTTFVVPHVVIKKIRVWIPDPVPGSTISKVGKLFKQKGVLPPSVKLAYNQWRRDLSMEYKGRGRDSYQQLFKHGWTHRANV